MNINLQTEQNQRSNISTTLAHQNAKQSAHLSEQEPPSSTGGNSTQMNNRPSPAAARSPSPDGTRDYDVTRMREEDFERLAVYIVPDVQCERGLPNRADKTLPRSLTLKPSLVFSSDNVKVISNKHFKFSYANSLINLNILNASLD